MFGHASSKTTIRTAAALATTSYAYPDNDTGKIPDCMPFHHAYTITVAARTTGSVTLTTEGSNDGTAWFDLGASFGTSVASNGQVSFVPTNSGPMPRYQRIKMVPVASFDGTIGVEYHHSVRLGLDTLDQAFPA